MRNQNREVKEVRESERKCKANVCPLQVGESSCGLFWELCRRECILLFLLCQCSACGGQPCALSLQCEDVEKSMREFS